MLRDLIYKAFAEAGAGDRGNLPGTTGATSSGTPAPNPATDVTLLPGTDYRPEGYSATKTLAEKIQSGEISLSDIPFFISYFIEIAILAAGSIAFLMIIVGGYQYIVGGVYSEMREKGKTTLTYAISGFVLSLLAYAIVTLVQLAATSF